MAWNVTKNFDPFTQILDLKLPDGTIVPVGITDIDEWVQYGIRICINYGSSIGASIVMLAVLLILTNPEKRRTAVFILNCITLALNAIQRLLQCLYFTSSFYNPYAYFSGDYSRVPQHSISISVAGVVLQTIQIMCLEASLILQVRAVCVTMARIWQSVILGISILIALVVVGFRMAVMVLNSEYIVAIYSFADYQWLAATSLYTLTGSICFFSAIFTGKLFVALKQRRKLGLKKFGPMQIIFIMGCQTLIIPGMLICSPSQHLITANASQQSSPSCNGSTAYQSSARRCSHSLPSSSLYQRYGQHKHSTADPPLATPATQAQVVVADFWVSLVRDHLRRPKPRPARRRVLWVKARTTRIRRRRLRVSQIRRVSR